MQPARKPEPRPRETIAPWVESGPARRSAVRNTASPILPLESLLVHTPKRRSTVLLLCLFLGWAGCHRFYVGKTRSGRIYLLTSGLLFLGVFVDAVLILAGSFEDRFGQPLV